MANFPLIMIILSFGSSFIYYDTGMTYDFDYDYDSDFDCRNGYSKIVTTTFSDEFEQIPQVFFTNEKFDQDTAEVEFNLEITTITKTSFTLQISCSVNRVYRLNLKWFAIDDQRIEVLSNFNMENPDDKTFQIKNPNAQTGFVIITSFSYTGPIDFLLSISQITTNSVTVSITKVEGKFTNLRKIGYFVVVGIEEAFINLGLQTTTECFSSGDLAIQPNRWFAISLQGLNYPNDNNLRIKAIHSDTPTTISYTWGTWDQSETPNSHSQIWIAYQFTKIFKPLECFSIRTSRKQVKDLTIFPTFYLEFVQSNQIYTTDGDYEYYVDISNAPFKMGIQITCENGKKIKADFNKCNSCSYQNTHSYTYNCFNQMNYIGFFPVFQQAFPQYNHLKINMQSSSLEIINVVYDQVITEKTIVNIQILDQ
ncbi:unnamed protein product (macronuclear) [Paramecium tetraurelia]|uniref:H-type lectin domain-containing protein n=1 Tax=Paramecium tetraurelia TaxID=5888 RepID=A0DXJ4_PARTE|nr:uncharacterized protein GSPATT00021385001 [Paramecium tetraurelia]CAK87761.1 unnamed protein product [Paramecium tetraurelia]|eukprot:XP_001455158.1 hypothetical protein (macronuclear) [Paramecium tetraurelia strain d4-2]